MSGENQHIDIGVIHADRCMRDHLRGIDQQVGANCMRKFGYFCEWSDRAGNITGTGYRNVIDIFAMLIEDFTQLVHIQATVAFKLACTWDMDDL
jgi:hypothetical protein